MNIGNMNIGDRVKAIITKNGYWQGEYFGEYAGTTSTGRIKVKGTLKGTTRIRIHCEHNVIKVDDNANGG